MKWPLLFWLVFATPLASRAAENLERVLGHVPEEAGLVIVTPNLDKLVSGLAEFGKSIDVGALRELSSAKLLNELNVLEGVEGLDSAGPFLMALAANRSSPVLVCRVRDAEVWRAAAGAQAADSGLWRVVVFGEPEYAALDGDLLIVGDEPEAVRAGLRSGRDFGARFGPQARAWLADNQMVLAIRLPEWGDAIGRMIGAAQASLRIGMMISGQHDENVLRMIGWIFEGAENLVQQGKTYTAAVHVGSEGVFLRDALALNPNGSAAGYLRKIVKVERNVLRGLLDDEDALLYAGYEWELQPGTESLSAKAIEAAFGGVGLRERLGEEKFQPGYRALLASANESSGDCLAIRVGATEPCLLFSGVQFSSAPQEILNHRRVAYENVPDFISAFGGGAAVDVACAPERIDSTDTLACRISFVTPTEQMRRGIEMLYGHTMTTYYAAAPAGLAHATGAAEQAAAQLERMLSAQGQSPAQSARVQQACGHLSPHPQLLVLVDAVHTLELAVRIARSSGASPPVLDPPARPVPLVAYGGYVNGETVCSELYLPAEPVKLINSALQSLRQASTSSPVRKR